MPLSREQAAQIYVYLKGTYGDNNVSLSTDKIFTVSIPGLKHGDTRKARIAELKKINARLVKLGLRSSYTPPSGGKTGAIKIAGTEIKVKDAKQETTTKNQADDTFKPAKIRPSIVDTWITPKQMADNVIKHINNSDLDKDVKSKIIKLVNETIKTTSTSVNFDMDKKTVPAEFFEVLSSIKLAILLTNNDANTKKILGIPAKDNYRGSKIKIFIPLAQNTPLIDYEVGIMSSGSNPKPSLKISVKSKVAGKATNTVKFKDAFEVEKEVDDWFKSLGRKNNQNQTGQYIIAKSSLETVKSSIRGKEMTYPLLALSRLSKKHPSKIRSVVNSFGIKGNDYEVFMDVVKKIEPHYYRIHKNDMITGLAANKPSIITSKQASKVMDIMVKKLPTKGKVVQPTVGNLAFLCEKIIVNATQENSATKYNFYKMFYDQVLCKKQIAYAVATRVGRKLNYEFYSAQNFQLYKTHIALRSKNSVNSSTDALGMEV